LSGNAKQALGAVVIAAIAIGAASATEVIRDRQQAMKDIGGAMQNLAAIAKKEAPFDAAVVHANAGTIAEALKKIASLFPEGSHQGDVETWAKPEIWSNRLDFEKKLEAAEEAAVALQSVDLETAFAPALGKLGNACKNCHQTYRRPRN
jgi:cytochrome c556